MQMQLFDTLPVEQLPEAVRDYEERTLRAGRTPNRTLLAAQRERYYQAWLRGAAIPLSYILQDLQRYYDSLPANRALYFGEKLAELAAASAAGRPLSPDPRENLRLQSLLP